MEAAGSAETPPSLLTRRGLVLGYAALTPRQIEQGIARLSDALDDTLDRQHDFVNELLAPPPPRHPSAHPVPIFATVRLYGRRRRLGHSRHARRCGKAVRRCRFF